MKVVVRRTTLVVLIFAFILGGITLLPDSAAAGLCQKCGHNIYFFPECKLAQAGQSGNEYCRVGCGSCCMSGPTCSVGGGSDCREVGGVIICEEHKD